MPKPLYYRITEYTDERCCDEWMAECPECGHPLCVFCEDDCPGCFESVF